MSGVPHAIDHNDGPVAGSEGQIIENDGGHLLDQCIHRRSNWRVRPGSP